MSKGNNLIGRYTRAKSNLIGGNIILVLSTRRNPTATKPPKYLLIKHSSKCFSYCSSLYPLSDNIYSLEYKGVQYTLKLNESDAEIL
jgi:hypothetical protein